MNQSKQAESSSFLALNQDLIIDSTIKTDNSNSTTKTNSKGMVSTATTKAQQYHCKAKRSTSPKHSRYSTMAKVSSSSKTTTAGASSSVSLSSRTVSPLPSPSHHAHVITDENTTIVHPDKQEEGQQLQQRKQQALPKPTQDDSMNPDSYLKLLVEIRCGFKPVVKPTLDLSDHDFFTPVTPEQLAAYTNEIVLAGRDGDVDTLKNMFVTNGHRMECCNRFGESLLHMACRRGFQDMSQFLLVDTDGPKLSVRIRDDCGRTPFHDACWCSVPNLDICKWLLERDPSLLLMSDKRGHTPFQYARQQHWGTWKQFLFENVDLLDALAEDQYRNVFC